MLPSRSLCAVYFCDRSIVSGTSPSRGKATYNGNSSVASGFISLGPTPRKLASLIVAEPFNSVVLDAIALHKDLVEMPLPLGILSHKARAFRPDLPGEDWTEPVNPEPHTLVADVDAPLMKPVFYILKREWKTNIHHHCELNDLG